MKNQKFESLGRCVSSMQFPRSVDDANFTQMTARLNNFNNTLLTAYTQMTNKNKNDALNEVLELGLTTLREELGANNPDLYNVFNNLCHEINN